MKFCKYLLCFFIIVFIIFQNLNVFADDIETENIDDISSFLQTSSNLSEEPLINSRSAIVFDRNSKQVLFGKNENEKRKMASTTKIMTAIIVIENAKLDDIVKVSAKAASTGGSRLGLHTNDKISVLNLLYGLLLCSGNDAAVALAEHVGGSLPDFASLMNKKCNELGLSSTNFVTPHGLDNEEHYTTAYELALITDYALKNDTFRNIVGTKNYTVTINGYSKNLSNTNELLGALDGVYGVKTGFTNGANRCLVTSVKRGDLDIICIVLGADTKKDRTKDSIELINYVFNNFEIVNIKEKIFNEFNNWKIYNSSNFVVAKGVSNNVDLVLDDLKFDYLPVNRNDIDSLSIYIYCDYNFQAPLKANSIIGYISVSLQNETILTINIRNSNTIGQKKFGSYMLELTKNYTHYLENLFSCIDKF